MAHSFDHPRPEHTIHHLRIPSGHGHLDEKHHKGGRAPIASQLPQDPGVASQEMDANQSRMDGSLGPQPDVSSGVDGTSQGY